MINIVINTFTSLIDYVIQVLGLQTYKNRNKTKNNRLSFCIEISLTRFKKLCIVEPNIVLWKDSQLYKTYIYFNLSKKNKNELRNLTLLSPKKYRVFHLGEELKVNQSFKDCMMSVKYNMDWPMKFEREVKANSK